MGTPQPTAIPPCAPVPGLPSPTEQTISILSGTPVVCNFSFDNISGLLLKCEETGVTLMTTCGSISFYFDPTLFPSGSTMNFSTAGGIGENCTDSNMYTYSSGSLQGHVSHGFVITGEIFLTQS